jgi:hypothetical protein
VQIPLPDDGGFVTVMDNLATATSADRHTFSSLTKAIATLIDQLAAKCMWAKSKEAEIKRLRGGRAPNMAVAAAGPAGVYIRNNRLAWPT